MGNSCACSREKLNDHKEKGKLIYGKASKQVKKKFDVAKLKFKGYKFNNFEDDTET